MTGFSVMGCELDDARRFADAHWPTAAKEELGAPFSWSPRSFSFRAVADDETVGVIALVCVAGVARIEDVIVAPAWRRRGVGSALVQRAQDAASYQNCHKMIASAKEDGSGRTFFERQRYRAAATLERHYFQQNFVEMVKWLW
jgi:GNAT superfamily N-acetyltransferase